MGITRTITGIWKTHEETSERSKLPELRTRYYKLNKAKMMEMVQTLLKKNLSWKVLHVDQERGEITIERRKGLGVQDVVITVYSISPVRSAIDIVVTKRGALGDLGSTYRAILNFFHALHKEIQPEK